MQDILVSIVVTVFKKEDYLPDTIRSLLEQSADFPIEYIFVDDVSPDNSVRVVEDCTRGVDNVTIIKNSTNEGPSIRINQGVRLARGKYVLCFDSDDILAANAVEVMSRLLEENEADVVYGEWEKTSQTGADLIGRQLPKNAKFDMSDNPLDFVLNGRFLRMAFMARRSVFLTAGGADERIFIQDESIPLRLAAHAGRYMKLKAPILLIPHIEGALSGNVSQLNHDRFLASYYLLQDYPALEDDIKLLLYKRCISAYWKQIRSEKGMKAIFDPVFCAYSKSRSAKAQDAPLLQQAFDHMKSLDDVRRTS